MDESFNGTLVTILNKYVARHQKDWDDHLISAVLNYNITTAVCNCRLDIGLAVSLLGKFCNAYSIVRLLDYLSAW